MPFRSSSVRIGRAYDNDLILEDDAHVSAHHLRIFWDGWNWLALDLGSVNSSTVDARRLIGPSILRDGSQIVLGSTTLIFQCEGTEFRRVEEWIR